MSAESPSILELARNKARNSRATGAKKSRNKQAFSNPDLLRSVAHVVSLVACRDCKHFEPDSINPAQGLGNCGIDAAGGRLPWPNLPRRCHKFAITREALLATCRDACKGLDVDPERLADFLAGHDDPAWKTPPAVKGWAEAIEQRGGFPNE